MELGISPEDIRIAGHRDADILVPLIEWREAVLNGRRDHPVTDKGAKPFLDRCAFP
jgi:hypothetical protein